MENNRPAFCKWAAMAAGLLSIWMPRTTAAQDSVRSTQFFSVRIDDDFLNLAGEGTDRYYTGGDYFRYSFSVAAGRNKTPGKILYSPYSGVASLYSIGVTQWVYTPDSLAAKTPVVGDYPYCGVLFLRFSRENLSPDRKRLFRSGLSLGVMGPAALGREVQTAIHRWIGADEPEGWRNQMPNYPVVNYSLYYEPNLFSVSRVLKMNATGSAQAGTLQTEGEIGLDALISNEKDNFFPGRDIRTRNSKRRVPGFYIQVKPAVRIVGYNSILEGGLFDSRSYYRIPAGQITRVLFEGTGNIGMQLGNLSIQYRQVIESAEFRTVQKQVYGGFLVELRL